MKNRCIGNYISIDRSTLPEFMQEKNSFCRPRFCPRLGTMLEIIYSFCETPAEPIEANLCTVLLVTQIICIKNLINFLHCQQNFCEGVCSLKMQFVNIRKTQPYNLSINFLLTARTAHKKLIQFCSLASVRRSSLHLFIVLLYVLHYVSFTVSLFILHSSLFSVCILIEAIIIKGKVSVGGFIGGN